MLTWSEVIEIREFSESHQAAHTKRTFRHLIPKKPFLKLIYFLEFGEVSRFSFELEDSVMEYCYEQYRDFDIVHGLLGLYIHVVITKDILNSSSIGSHVECYREKLCKGKLLAELLRHNSSFISDGQECYMVESGRVIFRDWRAMKMYEALDLDRFKMAGSIGVKARKNRKLNLVMNYVESANCIRFISAPGSFLEPDGDLPSSAFDTSISSMAMEKGVDYLSSLDITTAITKQVKRIARSFKGSRKTVDEIAMALIGKNNFSDELKRIINDDPMAIESLGEAGLLKVRDDVSIVLARFYKAQATREGIDFESRVQQKYTDIMTEYMDDGMSDISYIQAFMSVTKEKKSD